jgi:DNA-binding MarR family transcriptional regulator
MDYVHSLYYWTRSVLFGILSGMSKTSSKPTFREPVYNVASIFDAHRDLRPLARIAVGACGLTVPQADILVMLFGLRVLGWDDCPVRGEGYVRFKDLKSLIVHDPSLFTRRVKELKKKQLLDVKASKEVDPEVRGNAQHLRITDQGIAVTKPIWERYRKLSELLLKQFSAAELEVHLRVNEGINRVMRDWLDPDKQILGLIE